jgi:cytochrome c
MSWAEAAFPFRFLPCRASRQCRWRHSLLCLAFLLLNSIPPSAPHAQELRGHGGPVRAISIAHAGGTAITGSFDHTAIEWDLASSAARTIFRKHEGPVSAVLALPNGQFVTGGDDGRIIVWESGNQEPVRILGSQDVPVSALAVSPDGMLMASAGWEGDIRLWRLDGSAEPALLKGHAGQVNGLAFSSDGILISGGYDATVRFWKMDRQIKAVQLDAPINTLSLVGEGLIAACADGQLRLLTLHGDISGRIDLSAFPVVALAAGPPGSVLAAGSIDGRVILVDPVSRAVIREHRSLGWPVWALAFEPDGRHFLAGGGDGVIRRWNALTDEPVIAEEPGIIPPRLRATRGAEVFRACAPCHTLQPGDAPRAGPSLRGVIGRRIGSAPGYTYTEALTKLDIVWNRQTIDRLFESGPHSFAPGTKMPEQRLNAADRQALASFLEEVAKQQD